MWFTILNIYYTTVKIRLRYWYFISTAAIFVSLFINLLTVVDLYMTLYNPFQNNQAKARRVLVISVISSLFLAMVSSYLCEESYYRHNLLGNNLALNSSDIFFAGIIIINIILASTVMLVVSRRLSNPGMTFNLKK